MKRPLRPASRSTAVPALATLAAWAGVPGCHPRQQPVSNPPPVPVDAAVSLEPTRLEPNQVPMQLGGAVAPVTATPPAPKPGTPSALPMPAAAAPAVGAPAAAAAAAPGPGPAPAPMAVHPALVGRRPGVYVVHDHPAGTPCQPLDPAAVHQSFGLLAGPH